MKGLLKNKEYLAVGIFSALFILSSYISLKSIGDLHGNARVVNYTGIVRGATQKLIKEELHAVPDDTLIERLTTIVDNLLIGKGQHDLKVLQDTNYLERLKVVKKQWRSLQNRIFHVRRGDDKVLLFDSSQVYFDLVNDVVFAAEEYSESQVNKIMYALINIAVVFALSFAAWLIFALKGEGVGYRPKSD
jgi:nitrate/nitrite-specific signal transduction histidine kinase